MSRVVLENEGWGGKALVFDSDDIEGLETPWDIENASAAGGSGVPRFAGTSHLYLHFKPGKHARWESAHE